MSTDSGFIKIVNRITGHKLHNANSTGTLQSSSDFPDWHSSQWKQIPTDPGYVRFENRWKSGNYFGIGLNDPSGLVKYGPLFDATSHWEQWILEPIDSGDPTNLDTN